MTVLRDLASLVRVMRKKPVTRRLVCPDCGGDVALSGKTNESMGLVAPWPLYECLSCGLGTDTLRDLVVDK